MRPTVAAQASTVAKPRTRPAPAPTSVAEASQAWTTPGRMPSDSNPRAAPGKRPPPKKWFHPWASITAPTVTRMRDRASSASAGADRTAFMRFSVCRAAGPMACCRPMSSPARHSPLPPVERVRPGLWSVPVPIPNNPLRYVYVYAFETDDGTYLVDAGWNTDEAYATLCAGLIQAGTGIDEVRGVLVTHIHPDHYGLAGRVREASGAWVGLHPADAALIQDRYDDPTELLERVGAWLRRTGAPAEELESLRDAAMPVLAFVSTNRPDVLIED